MHCGQKNPYRCNKTNPDMFYHAAGWMLCVARIFRIAKQEDITTTAKSARTEAAGTQCEAVGTPQYKFDSYVTEGFCFSTLALIQGDVTWRGLFGFAGRKIKQMQEHRTGGQDPGLCCGCVQVDTVHKSIMAQDRPNMGRHGPH